MDALEFPRVIVETYYKNYKTRNDSVGLYPKSATKNHVRMAKENHHWIKKGTQRRCAKMDVKILPNFSAKNVMLDCTLSVLKVLCWIAF